MSLKFSVLSDLVSRHEVDMSRTLLYTSHAVCIAGMPHHPRMPKSSRSDLCMALWIRFQIKKLRNLFYLVLSISFSQASNRQQSTVAPVEHQRDAGPRILASPYGLACGEAGSEQQTVLSLGLPTDFWSSPGFQVCQPCPARGVRGWKGEVGPVRTLFATPHSSNRSISSYQQRLRRRTEYIQPA